MGRRSVFAATLLLAACVPAWAFPAFAQIPQEESRGRTLTGTEMLLAGVEAGRIDVVLYLLNEGADPNASAREGTTPLMVAAARGRIGIAELLLSRGANADKANGEGWTALMEAVLREQEKMVSLLLDKGADINLHEKRNGLTTLMLAARTDSPGILVTLLDRGAEVNAADTKRGNTALHLALASRQLKADEIIAELLVAGADAGTAAKDGFTPLMAAVKSGKLERVSLILSEQPDVNAMTDEGVGALALAASMGHAEIVRRLLKAEAETFPAASALRPLPEAVRGGFLDVVKLLIENGADAGEPEGKGKTPLILAAQGGYTEIARYLLENGADVNGRNAADGTTALMWAANNGRLSIVELLMERGANPGLEAKDGWTAAQAAKMAGHEEIARMIERKI